MICRRVGVVLKALEITQTLIMVRRVKIHTHRVTVEGRGLGDKILSLTFQTVLTEFGHWIVGDKSSRQRSLMKVMPKGAASTLTESNSIDAQLYHEGISVTVPSLARKSDHHDGEWTLAWIYGEESFLRICMRFWMGGRRNGG